MRPSKLIFNALILLLLGYNTAVSQQAIPASGGNASGQTGTVSFSIGQVFYTTHMSEVGSLSQGVQQPYEIFVTTSTGSHVDIGLYMNAFPNPTKDILILQINNTITDNRSFRLFDINGKLLTDQRILSSETKIEMFDRVTGVYFLQELENHQEVKSFRIIKN